MAQRFVLTAQLQLQAPTNVRTVVSQIRKQLQGVNVNIGVTANTRQLTQVNKQFQNVSKSAQGASKNVKRLGTSIGEAARRFSVITVATGSLLSLARSIKNATKEAIDFEREVVRIAQVTGKTTGQLKGMTDEVTRLATVWGVSSKEILTAARTLAQAGFAADKAQKALKILAQTNLAATFNSISDTTEGAIALLNQFRKEAAQTGGEIAFLERSLGAINSVSKKFAVESKDLISVVRRTGGVFEAAGGSINELIALFTSVRSTTRESADTIATGFRTIFTRVQRVETIEQLKKFGIELQDLEGRFVGPMEAMKRLSVALAGLDPRDFRFNVIVEQLGGFRQIGKVIPLIKQFSVAQEALKVAQSGSGSIARDAATAQQALSVQIQKVREEFAALIRSFADSETFRTIAKGALSLANAFIKVASALEPLLPLITTLFALKIGRGLAPALGAISGVKKFAAGGLVPGSGNRDTVPAMLTPGEFVIRKSSVNKMGAGTLAAMNENRFQKGTPKGGVSALTSAETRRFKQLNAMDGRKLKKEEKAEFENLRDKRKKAGAQGTKKKGPTVATLKNDIVGGLFLQKGKKTQTAFTKRIPEEKPLASRGNMSTVKTVKGNIYAGLLKKDASTALREQIKPKLAEAIEAAAANAVDDLEVPPFDIDEQRAAKRAVTKIDLDAIEGFIFEAFISGISGVPLPNDTKSTWDFPRPSKAGKDRLSKIFTPELKGKIFDAKRTLSQDTVSTGSNSIGNKVVSSIRDKTGLLQPRTDFSYANAGGRIDTVPAMLTPGEFVIKKSSAESIGYSNLNKMNKVGHYAKGGAVGVQRFADGGSVSKGELLGSGFTDIEDKMISFGAALERLGVDTEKAEKAMDQYGSQLKEGVSPAKAATKALRDVGLQAKNASKAARELAEAQKKHQLSLKAAEAKQGVLTGKRQQLEQRRASAQSAQSMIFLGMAVTATISQMGLFDQALGDAISAASGMAGTLIGLGSTVIDMATGFQLAAVASKSAAVADEIEAIKSLLSAKTKGEEAAISAILAQKKREEAAASGGMGKAMGVLIAVAIVAAIAQGIKSYFSSKAKEERAAGDKMLKTFRETGEINQQKFIQSRQGIVTNEAKGAAGSGGAIAGGVVGGIIGSFGGPMGTAIGASLGAAAGGAIGVALGQASEQTLAAAKKMAQAEILATQGLYKFNKALADIDIKKLEGVERLEASSNAVSAQLKTHQKLLKEEKDLEKRKAAIIASNIAKGEMDAAVNRSGKIRFASRTTGTGISRQDETQFDLQIAKISALRRESGDVLGKTGTTKLLQELDTLGSKIAQKGRGASDDEENALTVAQRRYTEAVIASKNANVSEEAARKDAADTIGRMNQRHDETRQIAALRNRQEKAALAARNLERQRIQEVNKVLRELAASDIYIKKFNEGLEGAVQALEGDAVASGRDLNIGDISNVGDRGLFEAELDRAGALLGNSGKRMAEDVKKLSLAIHTIQDELPAQQLGGLQQAGNEDEFQKQLGNILGPTFKALDAKLQQEVAALVFSASGGPITKSQIESVVKFLEEAGVEISDALKDGTALLNANIAAYDNAWKKSIAQKNKEIALTQQYLDTVEQGMDRLAQVQGRTRSSGERENARRQRAGIALGGTNVRVGDIQGAKRAAIRAQIEKQSIEQTEKTSKNFKDLTNRLNNANVQYNKSTAELKRMADQSARVADVMSDIDREQSKRKALADTLEEYTFATNEGRRSIMQSFAGLQRVLQTGNLDSIPDDMRSAVKGLLDQFSDVSLAGGLTGGDISKQLQIQELDKLMRTATGGRRGVSQQQITQILESTTKEDKLIDSLRAIQQEEARSRLALLVVEEQNSTLLKQVLMGLDVFFRKAQVPLMEPPQQRAQGGPIYASQGASIFQPRGTDTVPAMLTPGEFVIRKSAVDKIGAGNLAALNAGGPIYRAAGGGVNIMDEEKALRTYYSRIGRNRRFIGNLYSGAGVQGDGLDGIVGALSSKFSAPPWENDRLTSGDPANAVIRHWARTLQGNANIFTAASGRGIEISRTADINQVRNLQNQTLAIMSLLKGPAGRLIQQVVPEMLTQVLGTKEVADLWMEGDGTKVNFVKEGAKNRAQIARAEGERLGVGEEAVVGDGSPDEAFRRADKMQAEVDVTEKKQKGGRLSVDEKRDRILAYNAKPQHKARIERSVERATVTSLGPGYPAEVLDPDEHVQMPIQPYYGKQKPKSLKQQTADRKSNQPGGAAYEERMSKIPGTPQYAARVAGSSDKMSALMGGESEADYNARIKSYRRRPGEDERLFNKRIANEDLETRMRQNTVEMKKRGVRLQKGLFEQDKAVREAQNLRARTVMEMHTVVTEGDTWERQIEMYEREESAKKHMDRVIAGSEERLGYSIRDESGNVRFPSDVAGPHSNPYIEPLDYTGRSTIPSVTPVTGSARQPGAQGSVAIVQDIMRGPFDKVLRDFTPDGRMPEPAQHPAPPSEEYIRQLGPAGGAGGNLGWSSELGLLDILFPTKRGSLARGWKGMSTFRKGVLEAYKATGGSVDSVPAMLTPGEFVMSKGAVNRHGMGFMKQLNQGKVQGFNRGGVVYRQNGGGSGGGGSGSMSFDVGAIGLVFENFISNIQTTFVDSVIPAFTMLTMAMNNLAQVWSKGLTMNHNMSVNGALNVDGVDGQKVAGEIQEALAANISGTVKQTLDNDAKRFTA